MLASCCRIGPEVTKVYLAGGGSVGERGTNEADFSSRWRLSKSETILPFQRTWRSLSLMDYKTRTTKALMAAVTRSSSRIRQRLSGKD